MPFAGALQLSPEEAMVAKIPLEQGETDTATAMSYGYIPGITVFSPFHGSVLAVMESLAKLAAVGADPKDARLTFQEYFQRLHDDPARWGQPAAALLGAFLAQKEMGVPSIGGKDSMSGSFNDLDVPPTLVSFALTMTKASQTGTAAFQKPGSKIVLIPLPMNSETELPNFESAKFLNSTIARLVREGKILSCSVVKEGGAAAAIAKMGFGNDIGAEIVAAGPSTLFAPLVGSFVAEVEDTACLSGLNHTVLGFTTGDGLFKIGGKNIPVEEAAEAWLEKLEPVFPLHSKAEVQMEPEVPLFERRSRRGPAIKRARPRVFIPVFPGTNCEVDSARAFERAGAEPDILVVKNLTPRRH